MAHLKSTHLINKVMRKSLFLICIIICFFSCDKQELLFNTPDATLTGLDFKNTLTETDSLSILDYLYFYNGGGTAVGDVNNDGLPDIYLSGNQVGNKLYLNRGNLKFDDVTRSAGVAGKSTWNTGTIMFDANNDGLLDIYVCAVVGINNFTGHNELFINNGNGSFTEQAEAYGLDFKTYSTTAAVLDFDKDGDLDLYLLNHAVHTQDSYGKADLRFTPNEETTDKLLRNDNGVFTDVSAEMGIIGGINSFGLGISIADFNQDGWPDIYVGNDFHEDDYYYINEGGVRFRESLKESFGHTSRFSMGNDNSDINHDGFPDLMSLDMLPEEEMVLKASEGDDNIQTQKLRIEQFGYHYQFTRNMLYINQPGYEFMESALSSGVAATDWSWSTLFADFDQDGEQDIFISNGIPRRPNNLDYINYLSNSQLRSSKNDRLVDKEALDYMPSGAAHNYAYKGDGKLAFKEISKEWIGEKKTISGATALADLDNDGDLDLVVNNINDYAQIYENTAGEKNSYLKIYFSAFAKNSFGIGTKVLAYAEGKVQYKELYTARGFQASSEPLIHFGFGTTKVVDSIRVIWPDNSSQLLKNVNTNQTLTISPENTEPFNYKSLFPKTKLLFEKVADNLGIDFVHKEDDYVDFNRHKLIPYQVSDRGPAVAIGDITGDGNNAVFFGSSRYESAQLYETVDGSEIDKIFAKADSTLFLAQAIKEETAATFFTIEESGKKVLITASAGGHFSNNAPALLNGIYSLSGNKMTYTEIENLYGNTSVIIPSDYDRDGDMDLFVGNHTVTNNFGKTPASYVLRNNGGTFTKDPSFKDEEIGMVTAAVWSDFNADGVDDLIVIGEWMQPTFFTNTNGVLKKTELLAQDISGLWQAIEPFDIDNDGDIDYLLGNWGTNSKFTATDKAPMKMYVADFDANGQPESVVATSKNGKYYPIQDLTALGAQMPVLNKKYRTYTEFAGQTVEDIFEKKLNDAILLEVNTLQSGYLQNNNGSFTFVPFGIKMQVSPIVDFVSYDFTGDGKLEVLAGGNYFGVKPYHGRMDSFSGALIESSENITFGYQIGLDFAQRSLRHLDIITLNNKHYLLATFNNDAAQVYEIVQ